MTSDLSVPATPLHPSANEEINAVPTGSLPQSTIKNLELNPDLYDSDMEKEEEEAIAEEKSHNSQQVIDNNYPIDKDPVIEFEDPTIDIALFTLPYEKAKQLLVAEFTSQPSRQTLTLAQQSKLINYVDEQLLGIQRRFIKSYVEGENKYPMITILKDLSKVIDLIWYSINKNNKLFGQTSYLLKIMGDLEEYIMKLDIPSAMPLTNEQKADFMELFVLLQKLDVRLAFLLDGYIYTGDNSVQKISVTESVRLGPVTSRLRVVVNEVFNPLRQNLMRSDTKESRDLLNVLEAEMGKAFEGILDKLGQA